MRLTSCRIRIAVMALLAGLLAGAVHAEEKKGEGRKAGPVRVLMLTGGGYHDYEKLPAEVARQVERGGDITFRISSDFTALNADALDTWDVVMFNTCMDKGLGEPQRKALVEALRKGKGMIVLHCGLYSFQDWPEFRKIAGGLVLTHAEFGPMEVEVVDRNHPIAMGLPERFSLVDEPYFVDERAGYNRVIVQTVRKYKDRKTVDPQVWTTPYAGARVVSITFGHDEKAQMAPEFLTLFANAIRYAGGRLGPPTMLSELERRQGFIPLFDGKTLNGWTYDPKLWKVKDGIIIGNTHPDGLKRNSFAITEKSFGDFVLRFSVQYVSGNTGVQFRSDAYGDHEVGGYQADVVLPFGWGNLHEQDGRGRLVDGWAGKADRNITGTGWNEMEVEARGPRIIIRVNNVVTADWTETEPERPREGIIALQLHRGDPMKVHYTNIRIRPLTEGEAERKGP